MRTILFLFICSILLSGCVIERRLYAPTQVTNPYLQKAGDFSLSGTYSQPTGFDINSGLAITNRWALVAGYNHYKNKDGEREIDIFNGNVDSAILQYKHHGFHLGLGGYFSLSKGNKTNNTISVFGGLIKNQFSMKEKFYAATQNPSLSPKLNFFNSNIHRWFLQTSINFFPQNFQLSFSTRYNYVGYQNVVTDYTSTEQATYRLPPVAYPKWSSFLDFSFDATCYFNASKTIGLQLFSVLTTRLSNSDYNFHYYPSRSGIGLVYKRPDVKKK